MDSKRRWSSAGATRRLSTILALVALVGLAGSTFPGVPIYHTSPPTPGTVIAFSGEVKVPTGYVPQIEMTVSSISPTAHGIESYGSSQLQQLNWSDSEATLFEDYRSRRSHLLICIEIAKRLSSNPLTLTEIALLTRLNFRQAKISADEMAAAGLIQDGLSGGGKYTLTAKGLAFLESGERTIGLLRPGGR